MQVQKRAVSFAQSEVKEMEATLCHQIWLPHFTPPKCSGEDWGAQIWASGVAHTVAKLSTQDLGERRGTKELGCAKQSAFFEVF